MRLLRAKAARKTLGFYRAAFKLEAPYTVLVDGTFVHHALATVQTNLRARVEKILGRGVRFAVPAAVLDELRSFGNAAEAAARFCSKHCEVLGAPGAAGAADAVLALLGEANERKFVVATHDDTLQARARRVPGTPLLRFTGTVLALDAPSKASLRAAKRSERGREALDDDERALVRELKAAGARRGAAAAPAAAPRTKKRAAAPNPLSNKAPAKPRNAAPTGAKKKRRARK